MGFPFRHDCTVWAKAERKSWTGHIRWHQVIVPNIETMAMTNPRLRGGKRRDIRLNRCWGNCEWILKATSYMKRKKNIMKFKRLLMRIIIFLKAVERQEELNSKRNLPNENYFICFIRLISWMRNWGPVNPYSGILIFRLTDKLFMLLSSPWEIYFS